MNHNRDCGCSMCMEYGGERSWEDRPKPKPVSETQSLLESWWNEDPEMRYAEILCGEHLRVCVRLFHIIMEDGSAAKVAEAEAGTLEEAVRQAVGMVVKAK